MIDKTRWFFSFLTYTATLYQVNPGGKFTMEKLAISFVVKFHSYGPSISISKCRSRYKADLVVYIVSFISSSIE